MLKISRDTRAFQICLAIGDVNNIMNVTDFRVVIFAEDEARLLDNDEVIADVIHKRD
jgi:hypothetical protein